MQNKDSQTVFYPLNSRLYFIIISLFLDSMKYFNKNKFWQWKWAVLQTYICQVSYFLPTMNKEYYIRHKAFHIMFWNWYNSGISNYAKQLLKSDASKEKLHIILPNDKLVWRVLFWYLWHYPENSMWNWHGFGCWVNTAYQAIHSL